MEWEVIGNREMECEKGTKGMERELGDRLEEIYTAVRSWHRREEERETTSTEAQGKERVAHPTATHPRDPPL